ncbi:MAG: phosphodiester glycosidase family protein [Bacteroidetes bacterium]|nr:phosphodiester glycosidase family protein [Bacteroidota bacterium]
MQVRPVLLNLPLLFLALAGRAQLHWKKVDSVYGPLPGSVHVYQCIDTLNSFPFVAYYVTARLKDKALQFTAQTGSGKRYTPQQYYQLEQRPLLVVNCTFFSFTTNQNFNVVVRDGKMQAYNISSLRGTGVDSLLYYYPTRSAIGIDRKRRADVAWLFTDSSRRWPYAFEDRPVVAKGADSVPSIYSLNDIEWKWWKMRTAVGGGPTLIHDGKIFITDRQEQLFPGEGSDGDHHPRTAMGYTRDGRLIILAIQGRTPGVAVGATLEEEAQILRSLGCYEALNLDGGGSTCLLVNGKETVRPSDKTGQRPVPAVFLIKWNNQ